MYNWRVTMICFKCLPLIWNFLLCTLAIVLWKNPRIKIHLTNVFFFGLFLPVLNNTRYEYYPCTFSGFDGRDSGVHSWDSKGCHRETRVVRVFFLDKYTSSKSLLKLSLDPRHLVEKLPNKKASNSRPTQSDRLPILLKNISFIFM